jgi:hypothetical protein
MIGRDGAATTTAKAVKPPFDAKSDRAKLGQGLAMKLTPDEWLDLYCILMRYYDGVYPGVESMLANVEQRDPRQPITGLSGLKQTVHELFTLHSPFLEHEREQLDGELKKKGLPPLHVIEARRTKSFRSILKRQRIRSEDEAYIVQGLLEDDKASISDDERAEFARLMNEFGTRRST